MVWHTSHQVFEPLGKLQLNAACIVTGTMARCRTQGFYNETAWEPLCHRREFHRLVLTFKIINGTASSYPSDLIPKVVQDMTDYRLRNRGDIDVSLTHLNLYSNSFIPQTTRLWNGLSRVEKIYLLLKLLKPSMLVLYPRRTHYFILGVDSSLPFMQD